MDSDEHRWTVRTESVCRGADFNAKPQSRRDAKTEKGWTELIHCGPAFAKAMAGRDAKGRQLLPGGGERRSAPEYVTANSPEYAALAGLIHRDSPQYVTKKICFVLPPLGISRVLTNTATGRGEKRRCASRRVTRIFPDFPAQKWLIYRNCSDFLTKKICLPPGKFGWHQINSAKFAYDSF